MGSQGSTESSITPVVTLFGTYGAGVDNVGRRVAEALDLPYHPQAFSSQTLAGSRDADPAERAMLDRVIDVLGRAHAPEGAHDEATTDGMIHELVQENDLRVWAAAESGGVIVGRNGPVVLAGRPATVHVMLTGPVEDRIARAAEELGIPLAEAARRQEPEDEIRADMSVVLYGWDPREPGRYDLVLDTSRTSIEEAVDTILAAVRGSTGGTPG
ncbi:MAG: cytidylate kinase-like family protein [Candidatus Nanopelagicales bacterium]